MSGMRIKTCGQVKTVEGSGGYGAASTESFIKLKLPEMVPAVENARQVWIQAKKNGIPPLSLIKQHFPIIAEMNTDQEIAEQIGRDADLRVGRPSRERAARLIQYRFPRLSIEGIIRRGYPQHRPAKNKPTKS